MQNKQHKAFISIFAIFFSAIVSSVLMAVFVLLIKQIQLLNIDSSSFQAFYVADSAIECAISKEKDAQKEVVLLSLATTSPRVGVWDKTVFRTENWSNFTECASAGDVDVSTFPIKNGDRSESSFKLKFGIGGESNYCGIINVSRNLIDSEVINRMTAIGRSTSCDDVTNAKVVERELILNY